MRVLMVEDSLVIRTWVTRALSGESDITLLPPAVDGEEAVERICAESPDVVLMDLKLPKLDGLGAIEAVMDRAPVPIIVLSGHLRSAERDLSFDALAAGAVEVLEKPKGLTAEVMVTFREELVRTIRLMAKACVVRRRRKRGTTRRSSEHNIRALLLSDDAGIGASGARSSPATEVRPGLVAIGSSTGGPAALKVILEALPAPFPLPVVISQHIIPGYEEGLASWLCHTGHVVKVADNGSRLEPGKIWLSPADLDLVVDGQACYRRETEASPQPNIDRLFVSVSEHWRSQAIALLLTGMGRDGASGLDRIRRAGGLTFTQTAVTCVVNGMPQAARDLGAGVYDLSPIEMASALTTLAKDRSGTSNAGQ